MPSRIGVMNGALRWVGTKRIVTEDDAFEEARQLKACFDDASDSVLRLHHWNFAHTLASIAADATAPAFDYDSAYILPADFIRMVMVHDLDPTMWRMGRHDNKRAILAATTGALNITYISRADISTWDSLAVDLLEIELAIRLCERITDKGSLGDRLAFLRRQKLSEARMIDASESPAEQLDEDPWVSVRE